MEEKALFNFADILSVSDLKTALVQKVGYNWEEVENMSKDDLLSVWVTCEFGAFPGLIFAHMQNVVNEN